jgi:hypothetical protein
MITSTTKRNKGGDNNPPDIENKEFKKWLKLSYKRKPGEEKAGYYEYEGDFLTKEEMYVQWNLHFR